jgi:peptide/nickel transport system permease protein
MTTTSASDGIGTGAPAGFIRRFIGTRLGPLALGVLVLIALVAFTATWIAPYDPNAQNLSMIRTGPSAQHWLGTDHLGRDLFSRLLFAARISFVAAAQAVAVAVVLGAPAALTAGFVGGRVETVFSWIADSLMSIPPILMAIAIIGALGAGLTNAMLAVGFVYAPRMYRVVRAATKVVMSATYIEASRVVGVAPTRLVLRHLVPNIAGPVVIQTTVLLGFAVLAEASLSFLGLGVQPPEASWGSMIATAFRDVYITWPPIVYPGMAIAITVYCFGAVGDSLRASVGAPSDAP